MLPENNQISHNRQGRREDLTACTVDELNVVVTQKIDDHLRLPVARTALVMNTVETITRQTLTNRSKC